MSRAGFLASIHILGLLHVCLITVLWMLPSYTANCAQRPRIGLVLSGGGARGAAHVGVLKVLEELHIPVDVVVGTSMGAFVGGLYATGFSPSKLEKQFKTTDWISLFTSRPSRDHVSFRQKQDDDAALFQLELGIKKEGIKFPSELIAGQKLNFLLASLVPQTIGIEHFDDLPIRFRAVAADISTGGPVVLDKGDLAEAIRASMSVPGGLPPVDVDGRVLVDGGIVANLPVDVAQALGVDRIIAVDVSSPLERLETDRSVVGIAAQTLRYLVSKNVAEQRARIDNDDVLIVPDLEEVGFTDFSKVVNAIEVGEAAARRFAQTLKTLSLPAAEYADYLQRHRQGVSQLLTNKRVDAVEVIGVNRVNPKQITHRIKTQPGELIEANILQDDLYRIYEIGAFETVKMRLVREQELNRLVIDAREKSWGPNFMRFGMSLESDLNGQGDFSFLTNFRSTQLNPLGAEWQVIGSIGDDTSLFTEFFQPLDFTGFWFLAPGILYEKDKSIGPFGDVKTDSLIGLFDVGIQWRNYAELRLGWAKGYARQRTRLLSERSSITVDIGGLQTSLTLDRLDNANFPRHGDFGEVDLFLSSSAFGADDGYKRLGLSYNKAGSWGAHTLIGSLDYGSDLSSDLPFYAEFELGGFLNLSGIERDSLQGDNLALLQLIYFNQVKRLPNPLGGGIFLGTALEVGDVWDTEESLDPQDFRYSASLFAGLDTVLGPFYLGYGRTKGSEDRYYLFLGQPF